MNKLLAGFLILFEICLIIFILGSFWAAIFAFDLLKILGVIFLVMVFGLVGFIFLWIY